MKRTIILLILFAYVITASAARYNFSFHDTPVAKALAKLIKQHPEAKITFIYNELDDYTTSAKVSTDDLKSAVKAIVARNPITVSEKKGHILVEALQKGKYRYSGNLKNEYNEPVAHATILLLNPKDSVVLTYGITAKDGSFLIPCDRNPVIAKISSTGYKTKLMNFSNNEIGILKINTNAISLDNVDVVADNVRLEPDRTIYVPLQRQKNSSFSGIELIEQMGIPQLITDNEGRLVTVSGKTVKFFINFLPANDTELKEMNLQDVKQVEYLEAPSDPRFLGEKFVVNFIMDKYLYGGYVKIAGFETLNMNDQEFSGIVRYQYKKMTYDLTALGSYEDNYHNGRTTTEIFRFPQSDDVVKSIERLSKTSNSHQLMKNGRASFKATYSSDKITARSSLVGGIKENPNNTETGDISYSPEEFPNSSFNSETSSKEKFLNFNGSYFFSLPQSIFLTFSPSYSFSHTEQRSLYSESAFQQVVNGANDRTNKLSGYLNLNRDFGKAGALTAYFSGSYDYYRTRYSGSAVNYDKTTDIRYTTGANYSIQKGGFYGETEFGWIWDINRINKLKSNSSSPVAEVSLSYLLRNIHRINFGFQYTTWAPDASFKSESVVESNHLMSYTGNPKLKPCKNYYLSLAYNWIPSKNGYIQVYGNIWKVLDRFVYEYQPDGDRMIRYIRQPMGDYHLIHFGVSGRLYLFNRNLVLNASIYNYTARNGKPYNYTHSALIYSIRATYWLNDFYFSGSYSNPTNYSDGFMVGDLYDDKAPYYIYAGWANKNWNIRFTARNFARWNWMSHRQYFTSEYFDRSFLSYDKSRHASLNITVTYTFNYGKKLKDIDQLNSNGSASSGILRN